MNFQSVIVFLIVAAACFYVGAIILKKLKSFSGKSTSCESGCGCGDAKSAAETSFVKVQK